MLYRASFAIACLSAAVAALLPLLASSAPARAQDEAEGRFASLRVNRAFMRTGPGQRYPVEWEYQRAGWPVQIIGELDTWRQVRDADGVEGWMASIVLQSRRTVLVQGTQNVTLREDRSEDSQALALVEPGKIASLDRCRDGWCRVSIDIYGGWLPAASLWGLYDSERR